ncbi:MAG TPA: pilus assembly protein PilY, partial [Burkholderiales bacterium]|nr:pilus assembly protein PilY [Burkholderiales bacterium]
TTGERDVFNPVLRFGRIIFTTLIPLNTACDGGGTSWLMELDAITGRRLSNTPFDVNNDGVFTTADALSFGGSSYYVSGRKSTVGISNTPTVISGPIGNKPPEFKITSGSSGSTESIKENAAGVSGRLNWREIVKD